MCWYPSLICMRQCLYDKDGTWHDIGSSWRTSDCMKCYCQASRDMSCCQSRSFPDDCMKEFDQKACKYNMFKKNDPCR
uniref:Beta-microseminoprotein n=1 Tax=Hucho hucho TaxID=62062 RepID=A0A4W5PV57_9TELE